MAVTAAGRIGRTGFGGADTTDQAQRLARIGNPATPVVGRRCLGARSTAAACLRLVALARCNTALRCQCVEQAEHLLAGFGIRQLFGLQAASEQLLETDQRLADFELAVAPGDTGQALNIIVQHRQAVDVPALTAITMTATGKLLQPLGQVLQERDAQFRALLAVVLGEA